MLDLSRLDAGHADLQEELFDPREAATKTLRMVMDQADKAGVMLTPVRGRVMVRARLSGGHLVMTVEDTGIGIAAGDIPKALEYLGQVDSRQSRKYEGTGLGLPLSRQFTERHGGTLILISTPNAGTTVTVPLPREQLAAQAEIQAV